MAEKLTREQLRMKKAQERAARNTAAYESRDANVMLQMADATEENTAVESSNITYHEEVKTQNNKAEFATKKSEETRVEASENLKKSQPKKSGAKEEPVKKVKAQIYMDEKYLEKLDAQTGKYGEKKESSMSDLGFVGIEIVTGLSMSEYAKLKRKAVLEGVSTAQAAIEAIRYYLRQ